MDDSLLDSSKPSCKRGKSVVERLGDGIGAIKAYRSALSQQLLYPVRGEVEEAVKRLQTLVQKGSCS